MGNSYLDVLERIANALEQQNGIPIWEILINIIPWIGVIIPIVVLFIERGETKRPYVEVSFELVRSTMACLVIRNVGRVPAELKSMTFNDCFIQQLTPEKAEILKNKNKMNVTSRNVGQLIFDINGEYANDSDQDNVSLRSANSSRCEVYALTQRTGTPSKLLKLNFYEKPSSCKDILGTFLSKEKRESIYITDFSSVVLPTFDEIDEMDIGDRIRAIRRIQMYWAVLYEANFTVDEKRLKSIKSMYAGNRVPFVRNTINCFMVSVILGIAPFPCFVVKICNSAKYPASKKVVLYETHKTFYGSFGKRMSGSAQLCFKADCIHKDFVIMVPDWMPFRITMKHNTLHVVCKYMFRNSHTFESMDHTNKEIFRFCVRKEFYISFAAMMADHCKASHFIRSFITRIHVYESPVHLIAFASLTGVTASAVSLRRNCLSFWRDEIPMIFDISFYGSQAAHIPLFLDSFKNNF